MYSNTESYPSSALQGLRPVSLQNPARAFTSTKNSVHLTIFDQEIASPTLSSTVRKKVTQWFWSGAGTSTQSLQHKELMQVFDQVLPSPTQSLNRDYAYVPMNKQ